MERRALGKAAPTTNDFKAIFGAPQFLRRAAIVSICSTLTSVFDFLAASRFGDISVAEWASRVKIRLFAGRGKLWGASSTMISEMPPLALSDRAEESGGVVEVQPLWVPTTVASSFWT